MHSHLRTALLCAGACFFAFMTISGVRATPVDPDSPDSKDSPTLQELKALIVSQQQQIEQLRSTLAQQQQKIDQLAAGKTPQANAGQFSLPNAKKLGEVATTTAMIPPVEPAPLPAPQAPAGAPTTEASPISFKIGTADFTPLGFMDFTAMWRSTNVGSGIGTSFGGIPFLSSVAGNLPETRFSAQNSRIGLKVDSDVLGAHVRGYLEADFLGFAPTNIAVSSNSNTMRMRLYWVDLTKDRWEVLAGQTWSMLTPNRKGISPMPGDIFYSQDMDTNYQVGLTWTRAPEFRFILHPNEHVAWGIALEEPEQYIGGAVVLPSTLPATFAPELNAGSNTLSTPNFAPDIISKLAFDAKRAHVEIAGIARTFHTFNPATGQHYSAVGGGGSLNSNLEIAPGFRLIENLYYSDGGGRYIFGLGPDLVVRPDGSVSLVHADSTVDGFEWQAGKNSLLYSYYGGAYFGKNVGSVGGTPFGYGLAGSGSANRVIEEGTAGWVQTFWKNPSYGDLKLITQYSYVWREPWSPSPAARQTHTNMVYVDLRYDLP